MQSLDECEMDESLMVKQSLGKKKKKESLVSLISLGSAQHNTTRDSHL